MSPSYIARLFAAFFVAVHFSLPVQSLHLPDSVADSISSFSSSKRSESHKGEPPIEVRHVKNWRGSEDDEGRRKQPSTKQGSDNIIKYFGGKLLAKSPLYLNVIFYGNWGSAEQPGAKLILTFLKSLSDTSVAAPSVARWWGLSTQYYMRRKDHSKAYVPPKVRVRTTFDRYSVGSGNITGDDLTTIIRSKLEQGIFPTSSNALYIVLTSDDVFQDGLCTNWCGYHTYLTLDDGRAIPWAYVGHLGRCLDSCAAQSVSPNGRPGIEATIDTLAHEITEAATDPFMDGWYMPSGDENADYCSWKYGDEQTDTDSSGREYKYNLMGSGGTRFLVQLNLERRRSICLQQKK